MHEYGTQDLPGSDYTEITELPGTLLNREQFARFVHRYAHGAKLAYRRRVLEVACGAGSGLGYLARHARRVVGLDYTAAVLQRAKDHDAAVSVPLVRGDARALPVRSGAFDLILCFEAIYYLDDYLTFLCECRRVLTPGGLLLLCQSNPDWPDFVPGQLTVHYPSAPELANSLARTGFRDIVLSAILPAATDTGNESMVRRLRKLALGSRLVPRSGPLAYLLKRLAYGRHLPLPAVLTPEQVETAAAGIRTIPIDHQQPDRRHRVLYAQAVA